MKLSVALLLVLCVALASVDRASARKFGKDPFKFGGFDKDYDPEPKAYFSSGKGKYVEVKDEPYDPSFPHDGLYQKRFSYYGYRKDGFYLEEEPEFDDPPVVPFKSGGYYYDGSAYYYCYYDEFGTYYYFDGVRYYIVINKFPFAFKEEDDGAVFIEDPKFFFFLKKGKFIKRPYDYGYGTKG